jgi:RND family efflux transporter MFP subunit
LSDFNRVRLQVAVPEIEAALVATNQPVNFTVEGHPGRGFQGRVTRYSYALDETSKTMLAEIELPNPTLVLRPGMYASVKIGIEHKEGALLVPANAVVQEKAGASVFVPADDKARKTAVKTGFIDGQNVEIVSGLKPGQLVILAGKQPLSDGQPIKPKEAK